MATQGKHADYIAIAIELAKLAIYYSIHVWKWILVCMAGSNIGPIHRLTSLSPLRLHNLSWPPTAANARAVKFVAAVNVRDRLEI